MWGIAAFRVKTLWMGIPYKVLRMNSHTDWRTSSHTGGKEHRVGVFYVTCCKEYWHSAYRHSSWIFFANCFLSYKLRRSRSHTGWKEIESECCSVTCCIARKDSLDRDSMRELPALRVQTLLIDILYDFCLFCRISSLLQGSFAKETRNTDTPRTDTLHRYSLQITF